MREQKRWKSRIIIVFLVFCAIFHKADYAKAEMLEYTVAEAKEKLVHQDKYKDYQKSYGIDVSKWNLTIDWAKVKKAGVDFAVIRVGNRYGGDGSISLDPYFEKNIKGAYDAGIDVGVYFFTQAINTTEAEEEADFCIEKLKPYSKYLSYPVFIDIEPLGGRLDKANLTKRQKTDICDTFCSTVEKAGYIGGIYTSASFYSEWLYVEELEKYNIWMAHYTNSTSYSRRIDMWQYSSTGTVNGISGNVDMNVAYSLKKPDTPGSLVQNDIAEDQISLSWNAVDGVDGYKVYQYDLDGNKQGSYNVSQNSAVITGLKKGAAFSFKVRSFWKDESGDKVFSGYSAALVAYTVCNPVEGLAVKDRDESSVTLTWKAQDNVKAYQVRRLDPASGKYINLGKSKTNSFTVKGLGKMSAYSFKVRSFVKINGSTKKYGAYSAVFPAWTASSPVTGVKVSDVKKQKAVVKWKLPSGVKKAYVKLTDQRGKVIKEKNISSTKLNYSKLVSGGRYTAAVYACYTNSAGQTIKSRPVSIAFTTIPGRPEQLVQKSAGKYKVKLSWKKIANAAGYKVYRYNEKKKTYKAILTVASNTCVVKNLKKAEKYKFKVCAYVINSAKKQTGALSRLCRAATCPDKVKKLKKTAQTKKTITLAWKKTPGASGYQIRYYSGKGKLKAEYTTAKCTLRLKRLTPRYTVKVRAYTKNGSYTAYSLKEAQVK